MKKINLLAVTIISGIILLGSCTKETNTEITPDNVNNVIKSTTWQISLFKEDDSDQTYHFSDYKFSFAESGTITAEKTGSTVNGTWSTGIDDSTTKLVIDFGLVSPFDELNEDWEVLEKNDSLIKLKDVSGGDGSIDYLNFSKSL